MRGMAGPTDEDEQVTDEQIAMALRQAEAQDPGRGDLPLPFLLPGLAEWSGPNG